MDIDYWTACWTARAAGQLMAKASTSTPRLPQDRPKLVFVSSTLGLMTFAGYATYAPAKYAIRGLAETLRSELLLFGIDVHCFYPGGILSPGFEAENLTKPELTKKIEGSDQPLAPEKVAQHLLNGASKALGLGLSHASAHLHFCPLPNNEPRNREGNLLYLVRSRDLHFPRLGPEFCPGRQHFRRSRPEDHRLCEWGRPQQVCRIGMTSY